MVSSFLCFFFKTRLAVQIISHKIQQPLLRWSVVVCVLPFWEVNIGCVESHWHVRGVTFTSAERVARAPAARQLEISAGMQNLITTLIFTLSLSYSLCLCLRVSTSPPFSGTLSSLLRGAAHLHSWRDLLLLSFSPAPHSLHSYLLLFHFCIFSLYSSEFFFLPFVRATMSQAPLLYQFHQKANQQSQSRAVLRTVILSESNRQSSKSKQALR